MSSFSKNVGVLCILCILCILCVVYVFGESYTPPPITNAIRLGGGISINTPNFITQNTIALPTIPPGIDNDTLNAYNAALSAYNAAYQTVKPVTTAYDAANNAVICPADKPIAMKNADGTVTCIDKDSLASYCGVGEYWNGTSCVACPAGSYCPGDGYKYLCPSGSYCPSGASAPTPCAAGSYCSATASTLCTAGSYCPGDGKQYVCSSGSYCPAGASNEISCPAGSYCPDPSTITACPAGTYSSSTKSTTASTCQPCPSGTYNATTGASACLACASGYQQSTDKTSCVMAGCSAGQYLLNGKCVTCPKGWYCPDTSGVKNPCPDGYFCPREGMTSGNLCPSGFFCTNGAILATPCTGSAYTNKTGQTSCAVYGGGNPTIPGGATVLTATLQDNNNDILDNNGNKILGNRGYTCPSNTKYASCTPNTGRGIITNVYTTPSF